jgi:hypothetical protein
MIVGAGRHVGGAAMNTVYDWLTLAAFGALVLLFLQRSMEEGPRRDHAYQYVLPALCCPVANYLGNHDQGLAAVLTLLVGLVYALLVLKPFDGWPHEKG